MIQEFKSEFSRIAGVLGAEFQSLDVHELEKFAQGFDFSIPLINLVPMKRFKSSIGASSQIIWDGQCVLQFLTKASLDDRLETVKDVLIDDMINLSGAFLRQLHRNENRVFSGSKWESNNDIDRFKTSNYLVGVDSTVVFSTSCARIG